MSRRASRTLWRWRRVIARADEPVWTERMGGALNWMVVEKPGRRRLLLEAYATRRSDADRLARRWGGRVASVTAGPPLPAAPVRIDARLAIVHDPEAVRGPGQLLIPYGIAFGSGEHATTLMLLRALARRRDLATATILDLGTGSGVLALAARAMGARKVVASDLDPDAIRTAQENERFNFKSRRVRWQIADVKSLRGTARHSLILANLYSEILIAAAPRLARALVTGGELWLSGVLRTQESAITTACRGAGLRLFHAERRGRWVMQQWTRPERGAVQLNVGGLIKTVQTK